MDTTCSKRNSATHRFGGGERDMCILYTSPDGCLQHCQNFHHVGSAGSQNRKTLPEALDACHERKPALRPKRLFEIITSSVQLFFAKQSDHHGNTQHVQATSPRNSPGRSMGRGPGSLVIKHWCHYIERGLDVVRARLSCTTFWEGLGLITRLRHGLGFT